jgi:hypothetical protein
VPDLPVHHGQRHRQRRQLVGSDREWVVVEDGEVGDAVLSYSAMDAALAALDPDVRAADLRAWKVEYQTQDPAAYPNIATYAHLFPALDDPANFSTLIELLVDSIDARARRHAR